MNSKLQSNRAIHKQKLCVHDMMESFVKELLKIQPDVDLDELRLGVAQKFQIAPEHVLLFGRWPELRVLTHPAVADDLERRFGKVSDTECIDISTFNDVRHSSFWNNL